MPQRGDQYLQSLLEEHATVMEKPEHPEETHPDRERNSSTLKEPGPGIESATFML